MADPEEGMMISSTMENPVNPAEVLQHSSPNGHPEHPQKDILPGDSAITRAEKVVRNGGDEDVEFEESSRKRVKLDDNRDPPQKGIAPIKKEFLVDVSRPTLINHADDDEAEATGKTVEQSGGRGGKKTQGGQNHARTFGSSRDAIALCKSRDHANEFDEVNCRFGDKCKLEHDIRKYLKDGKREDLQTFDGSCPVFAAVGSCPAGWRCRFAGSHSKEIDREDGRKELISTSNGSSDAEAPGIHNVVDQKDKITLRKKKWPLPKADSYLKWADRLRDDDDDKRQEDKATDDLEARRATYRECPLKPSEKRRIYYGPETPVLAPLTTQGNLPFRRLCVGLGAEVTWSEMAMGIPLLQGEKSEWALMKAHESELSPPRYTPKGIVQDYDNNKDFKFGAQIAGNKPWVVLKTTEVLTALCPSLRAIDLNCGCPIDLVCKQGAGSALLDSPGKLEKMLRGMNLVSNDIPITVKIRMGTKDKQPTAEKLCQRLITGGPEAQKYGALPSGVAAITLHGRSRQQRYTRSADWGYIGQCADLIDKLRTEKDTVTDTVREPEDRDLSSSMNAQGLPYFIGNGDVLSHIDYYEHFQQAELDGVMIGRGALVKPWIFEEIQKQQYLDKSSTERLRYIEQFCRNGLEYWGSDEIGVGTTRRFLLEWLSFSCRYVPIGLLEHLPPRLGDRPPAYRGRDDLETLLSSAHYKDWIKISEMFLGKAHANFRFEPKHKSNSYEIEAEG
ncbi:hypothetical protein AMS68_002507 [Peltaster fructicola]|uniref:tRNA-dihydrouridine(47) synthase [NAD(P)(+)] n=1 Tax=Peltaster fructicola TaxID=286661 RepID=A0A6H0XR97_9PEZI|nr:hypothetical protein AMS68_002507 [Peltaster fructicola]